MTQIFTHATSWSPDGYLDAYISGRSWFILHGGRRPARCGVFYAGCQAPRPEDCAL